jgi:hypothetical protein
MLNTPEASRRLLKSAGYAWDKRREAWVHPRTGRAMSGRVSRVLTPEQVSVWLKADGGLLT